MRSSKSRSRNKSNRQRTLVNVVNRVFDSSGPEGKVRGTPQQIIDKYLTLARDAQLSGDRVAEQAFLQHAEHYTRMLGEAQREMAERQQFHQARSESEEGQNNHQPRDNGNRDSFRDQAQRDQTPRDHAPRDHASRDQNGRDDNRREGGSRDQEPRGQQRDPQRDHPRDGNQESHGSRDQGARDPGEREQPRAEPVTTPLRADDAQEALASDVVPEGLPDALILSEEEPEGPIETPETSSRPARSRAPRAPRGEKPAAAPRSPRPRRKVSGDQPDEMRAEENPAAREE